jgi:hypothetical protein
MSKTLNADTKQLLNKFAKVAETGKSEEPKMTKHNLFVVCGGDIFLYLFAEQRCSR